jgi:hypothetical protein
MTIVFGTIKENPVNPFEEEEEVPAWDYFHKGKPIPLLGRLYDRGTIEEFGEIIRLPDLYLAKKQIDPPNGDDGWASVIYTAKDVQSGKSKYEPYDGNPLSYHSRHEDRLMWLQDTEIDIVVPKVHLAQQTLERWDD